MPAKRGRPLLPNGPRLYQGRESRTQCVATALTFDEVDDVDRAAAAAGQTRSEWIREAIKKHLT